MNLDKLTLGQKVVAAAGLLLIIDLLFLPWHSIDFLGESLTRSGVESPNSGYGVLALLLAIVMVAQVLVSTFTTVELPKLPLPWGRVHLIAGVAIAVLLLLKLLVETEFLGFGAWLGIILGGALAYGGFLLSKETEPAPGPAL